MHRQPGRSAPHGPARRIPGGQVRHRCVRVQRLAANSHAFAYPARDTHAYCITFTDAHSCADAHANVIAFTHALAHTSAERDANGKRHSDANTDADGGT